VNLASRKNDDHRAGKACICLIHKPRGDRTQYNRRGGKRKFGDQQKGRKCASLDLCAETVARNYCKKAYTKSQETLAYFLKGGRPEFRTEKQSGEKKEDRAEPQGGQTMNHKGKNCYSSNSRGIKKNIKEGRSVR